MDIKQLVNITSRAWSLDILAAMVRGAKGRQSSLIAATGAGRTALNASLQHLIEIGLIERNPGHGHPLRPEFRLTNKGETAAQIADKILKTIPDHSGRNLIRQNWSAPLLSISLEPKFFKTYKSILPPITDRALSQSLKRLENQSWLSRDVDMIARPPRPFYQAIGVGAEIAHSIQESFV